MPDIFYQIIKVIIKNCITLITFGATIFGLYTAYNSIFVPIITLNQTTSLDLSDPFATQFILSNEGPVNIDKLDIEFYQNKIETINKNTFKNNRYGPESYNLYSGQKMTIPFAFRKIIGLPPEDQITLADIVFKVTFTSAIWPHYTDTRYFRFITQQGRGGNLYWFPQPLQI